jgi:hypothetical protein
MLNKWQNVLQLEGRLIENMFEIIVDEIGLNELKESRFNVWQQPKEFIP